MSVGAAVTWAPVLAALISLGCGDEPATAARTVTLLEQAISQDLGQRLSTWVRARCFRFGPACSAHLPDGTALPIAVARRAGAWEWRVVGLVITTEQVAAYLRAEIAELGAGQDVTCAPRIRRIAPGDRFACDLAGGGKAFVTVNADGTTAVELALDPAAAAARSQDLSSQQDDALSASSTALDRARGDEDGGEEDGEDDEGGALPADPPDPR